ncbi:DNA alkylation repair protein [Roseivirga sp. E12]|uniref:DNA alkylation repair protein n=1 Tax=Roseivirga sp. E12 TaxID=2819237 RepID=UPI001ABC02D0|nr:DNA alkylation repair protein [Roseivirga sp. E12]MBO3697957.1 DNA alkylation repair protein [Roseivirga sp. E12]
MKTITSQQSIRPTLDLLVQEQLKSKQQNQVSENFWDLLNRDILAHRVKFPILEYVAIQLSKILNASEIDDLLERLAVVKHESCYPVIGKLLQLQLDTNVSGMFNKAVDHIIRADVWYACDIISERVFGEGALRNFDISYMHFVKMGDHENMWIQRSIGIATHYATKKKIPKEQVEQLLFLMLEHGHKTKLYIKKGVGWPAKTIARFHPDLIYKHEQKIRKTKLSRWFQNKINIGLSMAKQNPISYE